MTMTSLNLAVNGEACALVRGQIIDALKPAEAGLSVPSLCPEMGIRSATFYKRRTQYGGMDVSLMARMKELQAESRRLHTARQGSL